LVPIDIGPAHVTDPIAGRIQLIGVPERGAIVKFIEDPIAISVPLTSISILVIIQIDLQRIGHVGTIVQTVEHTIPIIIDHAGFAAIEICAPRVRHKGTGIASITGPVPIAIPLKRVRYQRAIVGRIHQSISVSITITRVSAAIIVQRIPRIRDPWACVAHISDTIQVGIELIRIGVARTIVYKVVYVVRIYIQTTIDDTNPRVRHTGIEMIRYSISVLIRMCPNRT
jgi:hypothetical protein